MRSPKSSKIIDKHAKQRLSTLPDSPKKLQDCSANKQSLAKDNQKHLQAYFMFKQRLLRAIGSHDPLEILQLGIFQEYQRLFIQKSCQQILINDQKNNLSNEQAATSDFENVLHSYLIDNGLKITQVQRKSLSCQKFSKEKNLKRKHEEQKNIEFAIFSSYLKKVNNQRNEQLRKYQSNQNKILGNFEQNNQSLTEQSTQDAKLSQIRKQNKEIKQRIEEISFQLQNQKRRIANVITEKNDRQLSFLLKEKLMNKKLTDAKQQIEALKSSLDLIQQEFSRLNMSIKPQQHIKIASLPKGSLGSIKQKIENEYKMKQLLNQLSKVEFQNICEFKK